MKKFLTALLVGAFGIGAFAQRVVYDYKATFKRVDPQYKIRTIREASGSRKAITESYKIASDSITGFVVLPVCSGVDKCNGTLQSSLTLDEFGSSPTELDYVAYLVRRGDKISKKAGLPFVLKTNVWARSAIFGNNAFVIDDKEGDNTPSSLKELKNAWMTVQFYTPDYDKILPYDKIDSGLILKNYGGYSLFYGIVGLDNRLGSSVYNKGFGTVKTLTQAEASKIGWCGGSTTAATACSIIQSISGSTIGEFGYQGACGLTPMWDLCNPTHTGAATTAPIAGTWTLKYNKSLSELTGSALSDAILKKLKATSNDVVSYTSFYTDNDSDLHPKSAGYDIVVPTDPDN
jgi:uncharacterized protein (DUF697 family)